MFKNLKLVSLTFFVILSFFFLLQANSEAALTSTSTKMLEVEQKLGEATGKITQTISQKIETVEKKIMESKTLKEVETANNKTAVKDTVVLVETEKGTFKIKLFMEDAPITAGNFLDLVKRKFYNGLTFHRIIAGFVVQGGCPNGTGTGNFVDPETHKPRYIKHEWSSKYSHNKAGMVSMARTADPDSASSQFFIDLAPLPSLNPGGVDKAGYSIFGEVIEGMDVVNKIVKDNVPPYPGSDGTANPVKILSARVED